MRLSSVVLPLPRKPVRIVVGIRRGVFLALMADQISRTVGAADRVGKRAQRLGTVLQAQTYQRPAAWHARYTVRNVITLHLSLKERRCNRFSQWNRGVFTRPGLLRRDALRVVDVAHGIADTYRRHRK